MSKEGTVRITVLEWKEGDTRPGYDRAERNDCLESSDLPLGGQAPMRGDILSFRLPNVNPPSSDNDWGYSHYVVLERNLEWHHREEGESGLEPLKLSRIFVYVRHIDDFGHLAKLPPQSA